MATDQSLFGKFMMNSKLADFFQSSSSGLWRYLRETNHHTALHRLSLIASILVNSRRQARLCRVMFRSELLPALLKQPYLPIKYIKKNYLAFNLKPEVRARLITDHYELIVDKFSGRTRNLIEETPIVWTHVGNAMKHEISILFSTDVNYEGELTLCYLTDSKPLYWMGFSFVRGRSMGLQADGSIFLTRMQMWENYENFRRAAKDCFDIYPPFTLFSALEGLADALELEGIVAVNAANQASIESGQYCNKTAYDEVFAAMGATPLSEQPEMLAGALEKHDLKDYFWLSRIREESPLTEKNPTHRSRAKRRRNFRISVRSQAAENLRAFIGRNAVPARDSASSGHEKAAPVLNRVRPRPRLTPANPRRLAATMIRSTSARIVHLAQRCFRSEKSESESEA
jgi:uncharacterized protein VirK/YbjX